MASTTNCLVLIPGAGGRAWYWHRLVDELGRRGRETVAVDLPAGDDGAGLAEFAETVVAAIGERRGLVVVAQSMGGFTAPLVLLNAMVPRPGESPGEWWTNTGHAEAMQAQAERDGRVLADDPNQLDAFFHDVPPDVTAEAMAQGEPVQSATPFARPWPLARWPDVATRFLQARDDRFFPLEFQRRVVRERLGIPVDELAGGHLVALSQPVALADRLEAYTAEGGVDADPG